MTPTFRFGNLDDLRSVYEVFVKTTADLEHRMGTPEGENMWTDPARIEAYWERRHKLFEHLVLTAELFWVAEEDGHIIGYANSSLRDGVRELIEFFVLPDFQSVGVGRELLRRSFPSGEGHPRGGTNVRYRSIIGTTDIHAMARYLKAGVYPRFPIYYLYRQPEAVQVTTDLDFEPVTASSDTLAALRVIDQVILGFTRDLDHEFLLSDRRTCIFTRGGQAVGYGYFGKGNGPIALLNESDYPAVLAYLESEAASRGEEEFGMYLPLINRCAVDQLLGRGYQMEEFTVLFFSDQPFGRFENYVFTTPPYFM